MEKAADTSGPEARRLGRRQMIAGSGLAAAAWAAPSIFHIDVASAAGSGLSMVSVFPNGGLDPCVTLTDEFFMSLSTGETTSIGGTPTIGAFGNGSGDLGSTFRVEVTGVPAGTMVTVTVEICYRSQWETTGGNADCMDILLDGSSLFGMPIKPGLPATTLQCVSYPFSAVAHSSASPVVLEVIGTPTANAEEFGIASAILTFN